MNDKNLKAFVDLKRQIRELQEQYDGMKPKVIDHVKRQGGELVVSGGRLVVKTVQTYGFSEIVTGLKNALRDLKQREREEGSATVVKSTEFVMAYLKVKVDAPTHRPHGRKKEEPYSEMRKKYPRAYELWDQEEEDTLVSEFKEGATIPELADLLQRQQGGIRSKLRKLGLIQ